MFIQKKLLGLMTTLLVLLILTGCQSKEEKAFEELQMKVETLTAKGYKYYEEDKYQKAIAAFSEVLDLDSSQIEVEEKLESIELELKNVKKTKVFLDGLYEIQRNKLRSGITVSASEFEYIMKDISILIDDFEKIKTDDSNEINDLILQIRNDDSYNGYQTLKEEAENKVFEDGGTTDLLSELDSAFASLSSGFIALNRDKVQNSIKKILFEEIPSKYDSLFED